MNSGLCFGTQVPFRSSLALGWFQTGKPSPVLESSPLESNH